jgi:hypothetical protein
MSRRELLAVACIAAALVWLALYFWSGGNESPFGKWVLVMAGFNLVIIAGLFDFIKPWQRTVTRLAFLDTAAVLGLVFLYVKKIPLKLGNFGVPDFEIDDLLHNSVFLLLVAVLAVKCALTWSYAHELNATGMSEKARQVPAVFQVLSGALIALFTGGCAVLLGGFKIPSNTTEFVMIGMLGWLPFLIGLWTVYVGLQRMSRGD